LNSYPGEAILENKVLGLKATLLLNSERLKERHNQITIELQELQSKLELKSEKALTEQKNELQVLIDRNLDTQRKFEYYLKSSLNIDIALLKREDLESLLTVREKETRLKLEADSKVKAEYERLEKYTVNLLPYIQTENVKDKIQFNEELLTYLTGTVNVALESERDKTREYLEKQVSEFFYISLINSLYSKIDPHPNFKSVDFRVNFDSDNPRLDIYVINSEREELLIPNLYFSTAQINILSLSIFLASALNSNMYECIFIDDPIQSLDSINILSTIDLIRSIVINQNRQVILSTHDENFHNLLKKKMPPALFKSKFLELETFGKVKK
jgi:exonuclease SbcC